MRSEHERRRARYVAREHAMGRPMKVPAEPIRRHRDRLRSLGMTDQAIADAAAANGHHVHQTTISTCGKLKNVHRDTAAAILSVTEERAEPQPHSPVPVVAMQRVIGGLMCAGYSLNWISLNATYCSRTNRKKQNHSYAHIIMSGRFKHVARQTFERTYQHAQKLEHTHPLDMGLMAQQVSRSKNYAAKHGYVPLMCWDEDTILDPDAFPEWTGECGTVTGFYLHRKYSLGLDEHGRVLCTPCLDGKRATTGEAREAAAARRAASILEDLSEGISVKSVAAEHGVSERTVQRIIRKAAA